MGCIDDQRTVGIREKISATACSFICFLLAAIILNYELHVINWRCVAKQLVFASLDERCLLSRESDSVGAVTVFLLMLAMGLLLFGFERFESKAEREAKKML
jgi:hypothetical protein